MSVHIEVIRYSPDHRTVWDAFVREAKNSYFLFFRDYLEYHADRFPDYSLLLYRKGVLEAILPANSQDHTLYSHGGLTFGGLLTRPKTKTATVLSCFEQLRIFLKAQGFRRMVYKAMPYIYHPVPAQEDLYALFRQGATLLRRDASSTIDLDRPLPYSPNRVRNLAKAANAGLTLTRSTDYATFMQLQQAVLQEKYGLRPTHTAAEITALAAQFPDNISLHLATQAGEMVAGTILFESQMVVHTQYLAASPLGKETKAMEFLLDHLIKIYAGKKRYFDFGISTEQAGTYLNASLMESKERFGARVVAYDFYEWLL